ncbi:MAG: hypothetical protein ACE5I7_04975 [Candidatus Binatia bacterium]
MSFNPRYRIRLYHNVAGQRILLCDIQEQGTDSVVFDHLPVRCRVFQILGREPVLSSLDQRVVRFLPFRGGGERGSAPGWNPRDLQFEEITDQCARCGQYRRKTEPSDASLDR